MRIAEDRIKEGKQDRFDINVSSIGNYQFATHHKNSGTKLNGQWTNGFGKCYVRLLLSPKFKQCKNHYDENFGDSDVDDIVMLATPFECCFPTLM